MTFVVVPSFDLAHENVEAFLAAARADAEQTLATEPGCLQFDVVIDRGARPVGVVFDEVHADRTTFDAHLKAQHLAAFCASLHLCADGPVRFYDRLMP
jgi:quinol monooxygenase YgiN